MEINISLSQFISVSTSKTIDAKKSAMDRIKHSVYSPASDYWKPIRDELPKVLKGEHTFDAFNSIIDKTSEKNNKKNNFKLDVQNLKNFFSNHSYKCLENHNTKASWRYDAGDLTVRVAPEFNIIIDGQKYLLRVEYRLKKANERSTYEPSILLLNEATKDKRDADTKVAILNLQDQKLMTLDDVKNKDLGILMSAASDFCKLYNQPTFLD